MIYYQHGSSGNVHSVKEPQEMAKQLTEENKTRRRPLSEGRIKAKMKMRERTISKMDASRRWERTDKPDTAKKSTGK